MACIPMLRVFICSFVAGTYKIPSANDIPLDFCVMLLKDSPNHRLPMVYSSKAVGEPPFFLGASVFFALKEAVYAARKDAGLEGWFQLDSPATPERLRMACADHLTEPFGGADIHVKLSC
jgi:xanthine dehydrogenase/oxidase